jgi:hypothetical protein
VKATVEAARRGAGIPGGLRPPIDKLASDDWLFPSNDCVADFGQTRPKKVCAFGDATSKRSIVVIGESHMWTWMPAILRMAAHDGWIVRPILKSGCKPPTWVLTNPDHLWVECKAWFRWTRKEAESLHPTVTIIGGAFKSEGPSDRGAASAQAFSLLERAMKPYSKHVVVMGDVPWQTQDPIRCLTSSAATLLHCSTAPTMPRLYSYIAAQTRFDNAGFIDVRGWFCYQGICPMIIGHTIAMADMVHMSKTYSLQLTSTFRAAFRQAIGAK